MHYLTTVEMPHADLTRKLSKLGLPGRVLRDEVCINFICIMYRNPACIILFLKLL